MARRIYNENLNFRCTEDEHDDVERAVVQWITRTGRVTTLSSWARAVVLREVERELAGITARTRATAAAEQLLEQLDALGPNAPATGRRAVVVAWFLEQFESRDLDVGGDLRRARRRRIGDRAVEPEPEPEPGGGASSSAPRRPGARRK